MPISLAFQSINNNKNNKITLLDYSIAYLKYEMYVTFFFLFFNLIIF